MQSRSFFVFVFVYFLIRFVKYLSLYILCHSISVCRHIKAIRSSLSGSTTLSAVGWCIKWAPHRSRKNEMINAVAPNLVKSILIWIWIHTEGSKADFLKCDPRSLLRWEIYFLLTFDSQTGPHFKGEEVWFWKDIFRSWLNSVDPNVRGSRKLNEA